MSKAVLLVPLVLMVAGCDTKPAAAIYAPHEVGLTLGFENPQIPGPLRREQRLQLRVGRVSSSPNSGAFRVDTTYTTLKGETTGTFLIEEGGIVPEGPEPPLPVDPLPKGFPDRVQDWTARSQHYKVLGRAAAQGLEFRLPVGYAALGVWVESYPVDGKGPHIRAFFLPDLGKVEVQEFQNGQWLSVTKLVDRGFTDAPLRRAF